MQTNFMKRAVFGAAAMLLAGAAQAAFEGRDASGAASGSCTATGATKCTYFYDTTLDITILNNWNIGTGSWSASAAPGSAQALAATAGQSASGLSGWVLPTGDGVAAAGAQNQYKSIWNAVGGTFAGLSGQFDGVQSTYYWSGTEYAPNPGSAWVFGAHVGGAQNTSGKNVLLYAVAVRPGDVAVVPEPQTYALLLLGLTGLAVARRRPH